MRFHKSQTIILKINYTVEKETKSKAQSIQHPFDVVDTMHMSSM